MKRGTKTTLIGVVLILAVSLSAIPVYGYFLPGIALAGSVAAMGLKVAGNCDCYDVPTDCDCMMLTGFEPEGPCEDFFDELREGPHYYGEDDDYIYLTAKVIDEESWYLWPEVDGPYILGYRKDHIQAWIDADCPHYPTEWEPY